MGGARSSYAALPASAAAHASYYSTHETGTILSTLTTDIQTIQGFASSSTLNILVDTLTIVCMLGLMFWLNWDFTLIAVR